MNKKLVLERRDELLKKLQKEVPNFDWEFQRLQTKGLYFPSNEESWETEEMYQTKYVFRTKKDFGDDGNKFKKVSGEIQIEYRNDEEIDIECFFDDDISCYNKQSKLIPSWDLLEEEQLEEVRGFFNTYMIPISKRIETKLPTPRISSLYNGLHKCYSYEFNEILLKTLLWEEDTRKTYESIFNHFEDDYNKLMKENNQTYPNGYFGTPIEMIKSFLEDKIGEVEYYLEQKMDEVIEEELETIKE